MWTTTPGLFDESKAQQRAVEFRQMSIRAALRMTTSDVAEPPGLGNCKK
jgi:hypothetical protein